jgi:hypothetical protein
MISDKSLILLTFLVIDGFGNCAIMNYKHF